jgi:signal transduction histidine kinase
MSKEEIPTPNYEELKKRNAELEYTLEETIRRSNVGTNALSIMGGLTHDVRNPLTIINICGNMMKEIFDKPDFDINLAKEYIEGILRSSDSLNKMTNYILASLISRTERRDVVSITDIIDNCIYALEPSTQHIEYVKEYGREIYKIEADSEQLSQMMINLLMNGGHAMPDGGKLTIRVNNYNGSVDKLGEGNYISIELHDQGVGIPKEYYEKIFEPFFTIGNFKREGTGLGLAVVKKAIEKHNGTINVSSTGYGTTFKIFLPVYNK